MPRLPPHPCAEPGCPALVDGQPRCEAHTVATRQHYDEARGNSAARGYDRQWRKVRLRVLDSEPLCRFCKVEGRITPANEVDHIDGNSRNNDRANLRPLCKPCHSARTLRDQVRR